MTNNPAGRPVGARDRATVFRELLEIKTKVADPKNPKGQPIEVDLYHAAALGQIMSAMKGNTNAWKEIQDSLHGKQADRLLHGLDFSNLTDEELKVIEPILAKLIGK